MEATTTINKHSYRHCSEDFSLQEINKLIRHEAGHLPLRKLGSYVLLDSQTCKGDSPVEFVWIANS
jgi:hypothetical protein